ncbi:glycoside hydrolase family 43 protein [uncultured Sunxiuqinia sp.]|uniref:glycoside hydrolase family 43 protein n=1 Tax=uncultured Sunxiuqinia sp. TaxID=1573825 RepID=UPI0030DBCF48|tara:strand:+ start:1323 stop:2420 length:1098 start_codon:yes stop_codon:yes gene_type:complete
MRFRNTTLLLMLAGLLLGACQRKPESLPTFDNPLPVEFGDPYILKASNGLYYMIGTGGVKDGFKMYSSTDLKDWNDEGRIYQGNTDQSWGIANFWAPELYELDGKFYLLFSADWRINPTNELENFRIGVAVSDTPTGPYTDLYDRPIFDPGYPVIDGNLWFEDGKVYLYYSRCCYKNPVESEVADWAREHGMFDEIEESWVYGVEMKPDFSGIVGEPELLLRPPLSMDDQQAEWESRSVTSGEVNRRWTEGSYLFKEKDTYYMMYSANYFGGQNYAVGYATSKSPMGPFQKADNNPVLEKNVEQGGIVTGTGHNMITIAPDGKSMLCVYHGRTSETGENRVVFIDPMEVTEDGKLVVHGPTTGKK